MKKEHYYLASRIPSKGGLKIIRTDEDFPKSYEEYIEGKCLEVFVPEYDHNAVMIHPLGNGDIVTALARKVESSRWESRVHENIHGYVMNTGTFSRQLLSLLAASDKAFDNCFYDWTVEEAEKLDESKLRFRPSERKPRIENKFLDRIENEENEAFFYSVYRTITGNEKIHLIVPHGLSRMLQAACYEILPFYCRNRLFTVSEGEVLQSDANIILTNDSELKYQKAGGYKRMELDAFIRRGMTLRQKGIPYFNQLLGEESEKREEIYEYIAKILAPLCEDKESEHILMSLELYDLMADIIINTDGGKYCDERLRRRVEDIRHLSVQKILKSCFPCLCKTKEEIKTIQTREERLDSQIGMCLEYMKNEYPLNSLFQEIREYYFSRERKREWGVFQNKLRRELEQMPLLPKRKERYVTLLFLAYENYRGKTRRFDQNVIPAPYDLEGMMLFLRRKTKSEREYRKYVTEVMRQYNEGGTVYMPKRNIRNVLKRNKTKMQMAFDEP